MSRRLLTVLVLCGLCSAEGVWVEQPNPFRDSLLYDHVDVCFVDSLTGYVLGIGDILKTTDGGRDWRVIYGLQSPQPTQEKTAMNEPGTGGICFLDSLTGWVAAFPGVTYRTVDGGRNWVLTWVTFPYSLNDVTFVSAMVGWAVGSEGYPSRSGIIHTHDGGTTWIVQDSLTFPRLHGVCFLDSLKGFAVGDSGLLIRTEDGGTHWDRIPTGIDSWLVDIQSADTRHGIVVGQHAGLRTTDGGTHWDSVPVGGYDVAFPDSAHAWSGLASLEICFSSDGGASWVTQSCQPYAVLWGLSFPDSAHGWAVGKEGHIFSYVQSAGIAETPSRERTIPIALYALQNPARLPVVFGMAAAGEASATLRVYDAAGTIVRTLWTEPAPSGNHTVSWNGADDHGRKAPPGVYICRLEVGGAACVSKVVLMH